LNLWLTFLPTLTAFDARPCQAGCRKLPGILFVGEALVGNEAVDQLTKFDRALKDFSAASGIGKERGIDGMLVTKWDTVDDKV
jgi:signal recognition particle GTPase